ncbi:TatD family hydrolase [Galenea microaerophila]
MIDTHCHLTQIPSSQLTSILDTLDALKLLAVSTTLEDSKNTLGLVKSHPIYPAVGLHPWFLPDAEEAINKALNQLERMIAENLNSIKAIGEIGLDYSPKVQVRQTLQRETFAFQLRLAQQFALPVSIHGVKSHPDLQQLLKTYSTVKGALHGFYGSPELAQSYLKLGFKIGIGPMVLRQGPNKLYQVIKEVPIEGMVLETDFPNTRQYGISHPKDIHKVTAKVAEIKQMPVALVQSICDQTAKELFLL